MKGFSIEQLDFLYDNQVPTLKFKEHKFDSETAVVLNGEAASMDEIDAGDKGPVVRAKKASEVDSE
jgi:SP family sugar:H+ symporter-like MFS transporter